MRRCNKCTHNNKLFNRRLLFVNLVFSTEAFEFKVLFDCLFVGYIHLIRWFSI